jgi:hypothetical protein
MTSCLSNTVLFIKYRFLAANHTYRKLIARESNQFHILCFAKNIHLLFLINLLPVKRTFQLLSLKLRPIVFPIYCSGSFGVV